MLLTLDQKIIANHQNDITKINVILFLQMDTTNNLAKIVFLTIVLLRTSKLYTAVWLQLTTVYTKVSSKFIQFIARLTGRAWNMNFHILVQVSAQFLISCKIYGTPVFLERVLEAKLAMRPTGAINNTYSWVVSVLAAVSRFTEISLKLPNRETFSFK